MNDADIDPDEWEIQLQPFLHELATIPRGPRLGRDIHAGYIRGCGLKFGNLRDLCLNDPVFRDALALATTEAPNGKKRTIVDHYNLMNIFAIMKMNLTKMEPGHIVEYGSLRGGSAIFMAYAASKLLPQTHVISFDTFEGFPETDTSVDVYGKGSFEKVDLEELRAFVASIPLSNLMFIEGAFADTVPGALNEIQRVSLAHIDCDVKNAVVFTYDETKSFMIPGGYFVFDDPLVPTCIGAFEAVEETLVIRDGLHAEQIFPHMVYRYPPLG